MVNIRHQSRVSSVPAPLVEASFGQKHGDGSSNWQATVLLFIYKPLTRGIPLALQLCMARPLVGRLRNEVALLFNSGGLQWGSVLTRKVGLLAASPRCYHEHSCAPLSASKVLSRLENSRARPLRIQPIAKAWENTRFCSSYASSSLVKMASDRDILSDEYVSSCVDKNVWCSREPH